MNLYYAGPQSLAGPVIEDINIPHNVEAPIRVLFGNATEPRQTTEALLERCVRHHLRFDTPILLSNPARPLAAYQARLGGGRDPEPAHVNSILQYCAAELAAFMRLTAHPGYSGGAALFVRDPALLLGMGLGYAVATSLSSYLGYATALGVACYVACDDLLTLPRSLRTALDCARTVVRNSEDKDRAGDLVMLEAPQVYPTFASLERRPA